MHPFPGLPGRAVVAAACLLAMPFLPGRADEPKPDAGPATWSLKVRFQKGENVVRESVQRVAYDMKQSITIDIEGQPNQQSRDTTTDTTDKQKARATILEVEEDGRPHKAKVEFLVREHKKKVTADGEDQATDTDADEKEDPLDGRTVTLERDGEATDVKLEGKGTLSDEAKAALTIDDGEARLLPRDPVKVGDHWQVDGKALKPLVRSFLPQAEEVAAVQEVSGSADCTLAEVKEEGGKKLARVTFKMKVDIDIDMAKALKAHFDKEGDSDEAGAIKKAKASGNANVKVDTTGELTVDLDQAKLTHFESSGNLAVEVTLEMSLGGSGELKQTMKGKGTHDSKADWKVEKE